MIRQIRFAFASSAILATLALGIPATAFAATDAPQTQSAAQSGAHAGRKAHGDHHRGEGRGHEGNGHLVKKALALPSLNNGQRSQIEGLAQEQKTIHEGVEAARAKVMTALAGQVDRGVIDRAALAPALKEEENAIVAARLREQTVIERLHAVLTAKQVEEVGGGKDFLRPAKTESELRAKTEERMNGRIDHLAKKLPTASAEERANIAARLRAHASK